MNVGLLVAATGPYFRFVEPLLRSAQEHFFPEDDVEAHVFTDAHVESVATGAHIHPWPHRPWPDGTIRRYHAYWGVRDALAGCDFLVAMDADMRFVGPVGREIVGSLVGTQHPGFVGKRGSYEDRPESAACVRPDEGTVYYCGGFLGGLTAPFMGLAQQLSRRVDQDYAAGLMAVWHDESHLNRCFIDTPPERTLTPAYCTPDVPWYTPVEPARVLALDKDHSQFRA